MPPKKSSNLTKKTTDYISTDFPGVYYRESWKHMYQGRPEKTWVIRITIKGEIIKETVGKERNGVKLQDAVKRLGELMNGAPSKKALGEKALADLAAVNLLPTVQDFWDEHYKPHFSVMPKTKKDFPKQEARYSKHIKPVFGEKKLSEITAQDIDEFYRTSLIPKELAPQTQVHIMLILRRIFSHALDCELIEKDPCRRFKMPAIGDNRCLQWFRYEEMEKILRDLQNPTMLFQRVCHKNGVYDDLHDAVFLAVMTGMREGEIVALRWKDLKIESGVIWALDTKNKTTGFIPMPEQIKTLFLKRKKANASPGDLVFPAFKEKGYELSRFFAEALNKMGWNEGVGDRRQRYTFHSLRHTFISWQMIQTRGNIPVVQQLARHKTTAMTMRYTHVYQKAVAEAVNDMDAAFTLPKIETGKVVQIARPHATA
ncbi:MAG: tyrosine-type recombinase/integrase [Syntrophobacter sp.]